MPWFRVDDTLPFNAKVTSAGNGAMGLWVRAGAWAMQQLSDGYIPTHAARSMGTKAEADRLVKAGLWVAVDGGYRFHQWLDRQPSREQVEADRAAAAERQRRAREAAKERRDRETRKANVTHLSHRESRRDAG